MAARHREWDPSQGEGTLAEAMEAMLDSMGRAGMTDAARAARAWDRANGDRERAHTCAVHLQKSRRAGAAPLLVVYVDTSAWVTEMNVNKDLYLARLANVGLAVSGITFRLSKTPKKVRAPRAHIDEGAPTAPMRDLTPAERVEVERLLSEAPESLRAHIRPSLEASLARKTS